jgi:hypothetical protein
MGCLCSRPSIEEHNYVEVAWISIPIKIKWKYTEKKLRRQLKHMYKNNGKVIIKPIDVHIITKEIKSLYQQPYYGKYINKFI